MRLEEFFMVLFDNPNQYFVILTLINYIICHFCRKTPLAYSLKIV